MNAVVVKQVGTFIWEDIPIPRPDTHEVLLRVLVTGLCRTDLKLIRQGHRDLTLPRVPGEEVVGEVITLGPGVKSFKMGQKVFAYPGRWCGQCPACRQGAENLCRNMRIMGFHRDGGFAEFVVAPAQSLIPLPPRLAPEDAVFAEPLSCCLNALEMGRCVPGDAVGIWGAGPAGSLLARAARAKGAGSVINIDPDERRCHRASGLPRPGENRFDLALCAVGDPNAYREAIQTLNPRGRLVIFSGLAPDQSIQPISFNQIHYLEHTLVGAYGCSFRHSVQALDWIACGRVRVDDLISHRLPLSNLEEALNKVANRECLKILLYPSSEELNHAHG
jgi:L-iditol 2-dehydrogenase